ncbi:MAG: 50S ribosomal protein L22 [Minisyncoccota bacterium]
MKAILKSYRQAPRKVRLVANLMKGKTADRALKELEVLPKRASLPMKKLLLSAIANAKENEGIAQGDLFVKEVRVDQGTILKRFMPKSHGSATPIHKHTSHVMIELIANAQVEGGKSKVESNTDANKPKAVKKAPAKAKVTKKTK